MIDISRGPGISQCKFKISPKESNKLKWTHLDMPHLCIPWGGGWRKNFIAKFDIKDGFGRLNMTDSNKWNFRYVFLQDNDTPKTLVVTKFLQMGWVDSPPFFFAASDLTTTLQMSTLVHWWTAFLTTNSWPMWKGTPLQLHFHCKYHQTHLSNTSLKSTLMTSSILSSEYHRITYGMFSMEQC